MRYKIRCLRRLAISLLFALLIVTYVHAQTSAPTMTVKKFVGENTPFTWDYNVLDEPTATQFELRWTDDLTKTTITLKSVPINLRTTSISAAFTPGFKYTYYNLVAVLKNTSPVPDVVSAPTNTVAIERVGRPPTNLRNQ